MIFGDIFGQKNWYLSITVHWRDNIDDKNPTNEVVVEGHYFTLLAIITYFGFDHGKILDIFLSYFVKRFSINNGCCLDPLQIEDLISWSFFYFKLCYKYSINLEIEYNLIWINFITHWDVCPKFLSNWLNQFM